MSNTTSKRLKEMFRLLFEHFGPQGWWPADTPLEVMVGAILTQNTNWKNVERAIEDLKSRDLLSVRALYEADHPTLAGAIRPAGYFNIKAKRLKNLITVLQEQYEGDLVRFFDGPVEGLRSRLISIKGIGPETADSILLYGAEIPIFVVDAYTYRILSRHGLAEEQSAYEDLQALFMDHLAHDAELFKEFHALIVRTGKETCRKRPLCERCALRQWGPLKPSF